MLTLVSCLYDLGKRQGERQISDYLKYASEFLLKQTTYPVIVYCDPHLTEQIKQACNPEAKIRIVPMKLPDASPYMRYFDKVQECIDEKRVNVDRNPIKDTALYTIIGWTKFHFLQLASASLPSSTCCFVAWIDFAVNHVASIPSLEKFSETEKVVSKEHMQVLCINPISSTPVSYYYQTEKVREYLSHRRWKVGGGFWVVPTLLLPQIASAFHEWIMYLLYGVRFVTLEDEVLGLVVQEHPNWFQFHYGDYQDILNLDYPRHPQSKRLLQRHIASPSTPPEIANRLRHLLQD